MNEQLGHWKSDSVVSNRHRLRLKIFVRDFVKIEVEQIGHAVSSKGLAADLGKLGAEKYPPNAFDQVSIRNL